MADLGILALGLGLLPFASLGLYGVASRIGRHRDAVWGFLVGVLAFLGLSHAMAAVLFDESALSLSIGSGGALALIGFGIAIGFVLGWVLIERGVGRDVPILSRVAWAALAFLAVHSVSDGLVLGQSYAGPIVVGVEVDAVLFSGTVVHRLLEGAVVLVPALAAMWRPDKTATALTAGLLVVPAAFLPAAIFESVSLGAGSALTHALMVFFGAAEAGLVLSLLLLGFLPQVVQTDRMRWAAWAGVGFLTIALVHSLVE